MVPNSDLDLFAYYLLCAARHLIIKMKSIRSFLHAICVRWINLNWNERNPACLRNQERGDLA